MPADDLKGGLRGRRSECEALDRLVAGVRDGQSQVLVLLGEAGIGKTALLEYVSRRASGFRIARAAGDESEMELAFAGLHQLCTPMLDHLDRLPIPQRTALATALGLIEGEPPDRFKVGLAVINLLAEIAEDQPLLCIIDDAQWLDQASVQALAFVARRLLAEPAALVFATRAVSDQSLEGLPELWVPGLSDSDSLALLAATLRGPMDTAVRERIVAETRGNPLALLELPRALTPTELAGSSMFPTDQPLSGRIEESFRRRLAHLPAATQRFLLVASAEPVGNPVLVWSAADRLGLRIEDAVPAIEAGLIEIGARVLFHHPLVRSAAYRSAPLAERQIAHAALAEATDPNLDPDRRAWHRAQATVGPDEDVAAELERSASRAQRRGGLAAAAAFLERSAVLSVTPALRLARTLAASEARKQSGGIEAAFELLAAAEAAVITDRDRANVALLRGSMAYLSGDGRDAPTLLLQVAKQLETIDAGLARQIYLQAMAATTQAGRFARGGDLHEVAQAVRAAPPSPQAARPFDLLLDALVVLVIDGTAAAAPMLRRAGSAFRSPDIATDEVLAWFTFAVATASTLWDQESWHALAARDLKCARDAGALTLLPYALNSVASIMLFEGDLMAGAALITEAETISEITGSEWAPYSAMPLAALRGRELDASALFEARIKDATAGGQGIVVQQAQSAAATLYNGIARYDKALAAAKEAHDHPRHWGSHQTLPELIEAAVRNATPALGLDAIEELAEATSASGTDWALGVEARSRALLSATDIADDLYREALERLKPTRLRTEIARTHLVYGEWLRRENRRIDAREQLRLAHELFSTMGAEGFAERARIELLATGETVRKRTTETLYDLTAQEAQIARMAGAGHTNPEIGAQLFISSRTVEWHLRKVYPKLGITSRRQLRGALSDRLQTAV